MKSIAIFFGALFKRKTGHTDPGRDWLVLLGASLLLLAISVGWNTWFFSRVVTQDVEAVLETGNALETYNSARVKAIFEAREASATSYRETHSFVDPSR